MFLVHLPLILAAGLGLASAHPLAKRATARESPPDGCLVVRQSDAQLGDHATLGDAIKALDPTSTASACIFIYPGTYNEKVRIEYEGPLAIYGHTADVSTYLSNTVVITYNDSVLETDSYDNAATLTVNTNSFALHNVEIRNTHKWDAVAPALQASGNKQVFFGVTMKSYVGTLSARVGDQYYANSYIEGSNTYVWGTASAWFENCTLANNGAGTIAAQGRQEESETTWFVFNNSNIVAATDNVPDDPEFARAETNSVFLGTTLSYFGRIQYQFSVLPDLIEPRGWYSEVFGANPSFYEFNNTGDGADTSKRTLLSSSGEVKQEDIWPNSGVDWIKAT